MDLRVTTPDIATDTHRRLFIGVWSLEKFLTYVDRHLASKLSLDQVSKRVKLSRAGFTRKFIDLVGQSFHQYLIDRRVEQAQSLLLYTDIEISTIADETGFSSPSHFVSVFHRKTGLTPAKTRARLRSSDRGHKEDRFAARPAAALSAPGCSPSVGTALAGQI